MLVAWYVIMHYGVKLEKIDRQLLGNCFVATAVASIIGARLLYVLTNLHEFNATNWYTAFNPREGGMVAYGGFIGGWLGSLIFLRMRNAPVIHWADIVAPTLGSGLCITRLGCYMYGCDFGQRLSPTAPGWLQKLGTFPHWPEKIYGIGHNGGSPAFVHHVNNYNLADTSTASFPVHPTQLYESAIGLVLFVTGILILRNRSFRGQVIFTLVGMYSLWRFCIEFIRDDPERGGLFGWSTSQWIALLLAPVAVFGWVYFRTRARTKGDAAFPIVDPMFKDATASRTPDGGKAAGPGSKIKKAKRS